MPGLVSLVPLLVLLVSLSALSSEAVEFTKDDLVKAFPKQVECWVPGHPEVDRGRLCRVKGFVFGTNDREGMLVGSVRVPDKQVDKIAQQIPEPVTHGFMGRISLTAIAESEAQKVCAKAGVNYTVPVVYLPRDNGGVFHTIRGQLIPMFLGLNHLGMLNSTFKLLTWNSGNLPPTRAELESFGDQFVRLFDMVSGTWSEALPDLPPYWCADEIIFGIDMDSHFWHGYGDLQGLDEVLPQRGGVVQFSAWFRQKFDVRRQAPLKSGKKRMLFIQRQWSRRLDNADEIVAIAESKGLEVTKVDFAELGLRQQLQHIVDADLLFGAHGNAYGWMPMLDHSAVAVEVKGYKHGSHFEHGFCNLARMANISYIVWHNRNPKHTVIDEGMDPNNPVGHNTHIPTAEVHRILDTALEQLAIPAAQRSRDEAIWLNEGVGRDADDAEYYSDS